ncbi:hypothetical protein, partial [Microcoleus sp. F10-B2]|uniref:hypothetical protein n=1 Tax=Microcoleus sp. F10-B2 TaxID=2818751 RepID=UPI002FD54F37
MKRDRASKSDDILRSIYNCGNQCAVRFDARVFTNRGRLLEIAAVITSTGFWTDDVTASFPPAEIRAWRLFCASARLKQ